MAVNVFPTLDSGAVVQYPAALLYVQQAQVVRFMDGTDQRYAVQGNRNVCGRFT